MENDYFYKPYTILRSLKHENIKKIHNITGRDELSLDMPDEEIADFRKDYKWEDKVTKYLDLVDGYQYKTQIIKTCKRTISSEQIFTKKIIFTIDDKYVACDIRGENKLIFI